MTAIAADIYIFNFLQNEPRQENIDQPQEQSGTTFGQAINNAPRETVSSKAMASLADTEDVSLQLASYGFSPQDQ